MRKVIGDDNVTRHNTTGLRQLAQLLPTTITSTNSVSLSALTQAHNQGLRRSLKGLPIKKIFHRLEGSSSQGQKKRSLSLR